MRGSKLGQNATQTAANVNRVWGVESNFDWQSGAEVSQWGYESWREIVHLQLTIDNLKKKLIEQNRHQRIREMSQIICVSISKWVPREFSESQSDRRFESSFDVASAKFKRSISWSDMTYEKWILNDNRKLLAQCINHDEGRKHFRNPKLHQEKILITV